MSQEHRSSSEIRRSIERTRAQMDATIDALEGRLSPREIADRAWGYVREHGHGVGDAVRDHPMPASLMGLGLAWLAIEETRGNGRGRHDGRTHVGTTARAEGRVGPYRGDAVSDDDEGSGIGDRARDAARKARHAMGAARETARDAKDRASDAAGAARSAGHRARTGAVEAANGLRDFYRESPLAIGAITFGLGLAAALGRPSTDVEDRVMGDAADRVKARAKERAEEAVDKAAHAASDAAAAARTKAGEHRETHSERPETGSGDTPHRPGI